MLTKGCALVGAILIIFYSSIAIAQNQTNFAALVKQAKAGDSRAQFELSMRYYNGDSIPQDMKEGFSWLLKSAKGGYVKAQAQLAFYYSAGKGVESNIVESLRWDLKVLEQSCNPTIAHNFHKKVAVIIYAMHQNAGSGGPAQVAKDGWQLIVNNAHNGNAYAQYVLARSYQTGSMGEKDLSKAGHWFLSSAEKGCPEAQGMVASMKLNGDHFVKDYRDASRWAERAAMKGDSDSHGLLAGLYYFGKGVTQNFVKAYAWALIVRAREEKNEDLESIIPLMLAQLSQQQMAESQILADSFQTKIDAELRRGFE